MKQTEEDRRFAVRFAEALAPHVTRDRDKGKSLSQIASDLGVTATGLQKQLAGGTPSIRTVAFAYRRYGVTVPYEGITAASAIAKKKGRMRAEERQLLLPFEITAPAAAAELTVKLLPTGVRRYRLQLKIRVAS